MGRARVFISYRRADSAWAAMKLRETLEARFGDVVFHDVDDVAPGTAFPEQLRDELDGAAVVVAVIGKDWLTGTGEFGKRRIDDPLDWVHIELAMALAQPGRLVIPLLIDGATLPAPKHAVDALPEPLRPLLERQAVAVEVPTWDADIQRLLERIADALPGAVASAGSSATTPPAAGLGVAGGVRASYASQRQAFRDRHSRLEDRDEALGEIAARVADGGYLVIRAPAWAGKTALMVHLADRLRAQGHTVVEFFIVERSSDRAGSFLIAAISQLLDVLHQGGGVATDIDERLAQFEALWQHAVDHLPTRLVLLVDGLDEQSASEPISPALPASCPAGATVVVTTRPNPDLTWYLPSHHALAHAGSRTFDLEVSAHAQADEHEAMQSIRSLLLDPLAKDVIGFLFAARGPLSVEELAELTDRYPGEVAATLQSMSRLLLTSVDHDGADRFVLGHKSLQYRARLEFGEVGDRRFVARILDWAKRYAVDGWPLHTPWYLVRSLPALVRATAATDARWWALLASDERAALERGRLAHTALALEAIDRLLALGGQTELERFQLVVRESELRELALVIPASVLVALARTERAAWAIEVARAIPDGWARCSVLIGLGRVLGDPGLLEEALASTDWDQRWIPAQVVAAMASLDPRRAEEMANEIADPDGRRSALVQLVTEVAATDGARALELAEQIDDDDSRLGALAAIAAARSDEALANRVLDLLEDEEHTWARQWRIAELGQCLRDPRINDRAADLAAALPADEGMDALRAVVRGRAAFDGPGAIALARTLEPGAGCAGALADLAVLLEDRDLLTEVSAALEQEEDAERGAYARAEIIRAIVALDVELATTMSDEIERDGLRWAAAGSIVEFLSTRDATRAAAIARAIGPPGWRAEALATIASNTADGALADEALLATRGDNLSWSRSEGVGRLGLALGELDPKWARDLVAAIEDETERWRATAALSGAWNDPDLGDAAADAANAIVDGWRRDTTLAAVAVALAVGRPGAALDVAGGIGDGWRRDKALTSIAAAIAPRDEATAFVAAERCSSPSSRDQALAELCAAIVAVDPGRAVAIARGIDSSWSRRRAFAAVIRTTRDAQLAGELQAASAADDAYSRVTALAALAPALGDSYADEALDLARSLDVGLHGFVVPELVELLAAVDVEHATAAFELLGPGDPGLKEGLRALVKAVVVDDAEAAIALTEREPNLFGLSEVQLDLVRALSADTARAIRVARAMRDDRARAVAMVELAVAISDDAVRWLAARWAPAGMPALRAVA